MTNDAAGRAGSTGSAQADWFDTRDRHVQGATAVIWGAPVPTVRVDGFDTRDLKTRREDAVKAKQKMVGKKPMTVGKYKTETNPDALFMMNLINVADKLTKTVASKQKDYGPNNIQNSPYGPIKGLTVRLYDKIARLANLSEGKTPENESLRDTFVDIAGYGIIGLMILDGTFPKEK